MVKPVIESSVIAQHSVPNIVGDGSEIRYNLWAGPNKVALTTSHKHVGVNRHSKKHYVRWETIASQGYYRQPKSGAIIPFCFQKPGGRQVGEKKRFINTPFSERLPYQASISMAEQFDAALVDHLGINDVMDLYPIAKHWDVQNYINLYPTLRAAERSDNMRDFVIKVYGKKDFRKPLIKASAEANQWAVDFTAAFKGLVPIDWIINFLRNNAGLTPRTVMPNRTNIRPLLLAIEPRSYRALLNETWTEAGVHQLYNVIARQGQARLEDGKVYRTINDLHDTIMAHNYNYVHTTYKPFEDEDVKPTLFMAQLTGEIGGMSVSVVSNTKEMTEWGNFMHNCIGSYRTQALNGTGMYGKVVKDGELYANFEIRNERLVQLLGKYNRNLAIEDQALLEKHFESAKVNCDSYWGKGEPRGNTLDFAEDAQQPVLADW